MNSPALIERNLIYDNTSVYYGAGIYTYACTPQLIHNTITQNRNTSSSTSSRGAGIYSYSNGGNTGWNNIITGNVSTTYPDFYGTTNITYTCCGQGMTGAGNINVDPMFFDPLTNDFSLLATSPCVDAGDPASPRDPDSTIADMGAIPFIQSGGAVQVPATPTNFTVEHNNELLVATLSWTNPNTNIIGNPLESLDGVKIYRDEILVDNVTDVTMGSPYSYDDESVPEAGWYEYEIVPYNQYGDGYSAEAALWVGLDTPGEAQNVVAIPDPGFGLECTLIWENPIEGEHGGYYPVEAYSGQKIYRNNELIATLTGSNLSYIDNTMSHNGFYAYEIAYNNSSGTGAMTQAEPYPVYIGEPQYQVVTYDWVEIAAIGANTGITSDDGWAGPFNIGFDFPFYDNSYYSQIYVTSNGWLSFTQPSGMVVYTNPAIPSTALPNNVLGPYWDDLSPNNGGAIYYYYDSANSRFIVEYRNVPHYSTGGTYTFETILYPNGDVDFVYNTLIPGELNSATVGIENAAGTEGIQITYNGSGPLNPTDEMSIRVYSVATPAPSLELTLTPASLPIQIPAGGGAFQFDFQLENLETQTVQVDVWTSVTLPNGNPYQLLLRPGVNIPGSGTLFRALNQNVPANAPSGMYTYHGYAGSHPNVIFAEDSFPFEKLSTGDFINPDNSWALYGWDTEGLASSMPTQYKLHNPYPNPFNPETILEFDLPDAGKVSLIIYDIAGREVASLVDGYLPEGFHNRAFNAGDLASGVYFARIIAGSYQHTQKLLLVK